MKLQPKELRIGNYVFDDENEVMKVARVETGEYTNWNSGDIYSITLESLGNQNNEYFISEVINGIPITEEWLLRLGLKKKVVEPRLTSLNYFENENCRVYLLNYGYGIEIKIHGNLLNLFKTFNYVHDLQNLHFALFKIELTIQN